MLDVAIRRRLGGFALEAAFTAPSDGVTALFGPSGAGKSSILAAIAGPTTGEGHVRLDGRDLLALPPERRRIGIVHQDSRLFPHMTVERNLRYGLRRSDRSGIGFDEVVEVLAIAPLLSRRPATLSGGERQRAAIGRALLSQPDLLLMDEPLAALDGGRKAEILPFLETLKARFRLPILYVTHHVGEARRLADHVVLIAEGRVVAEGGPELLAGAEGEVVGVEGDLVTIRVSGPLPRPGSHVTLT
ncbi:ATP-binding cassette domain-containing protein [Sphingomonas naphthae]|uniref:ATP-binding cassette domain-containing protein n=1 Tax=Sphingomonas naphthae TaxID=1813468 RepID=A0ABY7TQC0_9SPHN|nr:ATP-binding cassette domain-containing protein [Sphingomonas naphthae]WCT74560.1 ATP-binding cassette domain-containing protein [Sphingomonas naphthae]